MENDTIFSWRTTQIFHGVHNSFPGYAGECGKLLTVFPSPVMVYVVETATQKLHEVQTRCLTPCEVQKPAQSARHFRPLRCNKGLTDGCTHPHTYRLARLAHRYRELLESTLMGPEKGLHEPASLRAIT